MPAPKDHAAACSTGAQPTPVGGARWGVWRRLALWARFHAGLPAPFTRPDWSQVERLVFVCLANLNRSALAQALCEQSGIPTASCGLYTVTGASPFSSSVRVARDMGCSLERHRATHWLDFDHREGDLYLVMEQRHAEDLMRRGVAPQRIALLGHWARPRRLRIRDPHLKSGRELRRCFALIRTAVARLTAEVQATGRAVPRPAHMDLREAKGGKANGTKPGAGIAWT